MRLGHLYCLLFSASSFFGFSQVAIWTEDFGTGCNHTSYATTNGTWTVNNTVGINGADQNIWYLSGQENGNNAGSCGSVCAGAGDKSLHIGANASVAGDMGAAYLNGGFGFFFPETHSRIESPVINCSGQSNITLNFNYIEFGDGANDNAQVWYFDGASWALLSDMAKTSCCGGPCNGSLQALWTAFSIALPASANNNPNVQIGFLWINNDDGIGTDPSFAVDDIQLTVPSAGTPPVASFSSSNDTACVNGTILFTDLSTNTPTSWQWASNPSTGVTITTSTSQNPSMTFANAGTFSVTMIATNASGSDSDTMVVTILPLPNVTASTAPGFNDSICIGDTTQLLATGASTYTWSMNEGLSDSTAANPVFDSTTTSTYTVTGTDAFGCSSNSSITITVLSLPVVAASVAPGFNDTICLGDTTRVLATGAQTYVWSMNEGLSDSTAANPVFDSTITSTYTVTGKDAFGCSNNSSITITVLSLPVVAASAAPGFNDTICPGDTTQVLATGAQTYVWSKNEGLSDSTAANPVFDSTITSTYTVTGTDAFGCSNDSSITITVLIAPTVIAAFSPGFNDSICSGDTTQLQASGALSYSWNTNAGLSDSAVFNPVFDSTITSTYIVTGTDAAGCSNSDTVTVTVISLTVTASAAPGFNDSICVGDTTQLEATGANTYVWNMNEGLSDSTIFNPVFDSTITSTYIVSGFNAFGCVSYDTITISVLSAPTVIASTAPGFNDTICSGQTTQLLATGASTFTWNMNEGLSDSTIANPVFDSTVTSTYIVTGTLGGSCSGSDTITITVLNAPTVTASVAAGANDSICNGNTVQLLATGAANYTWSMNEGLSDSTVANPVFDSTQTSTYIVTGVNAAGCSGTDTITITVMPLPVVSANGPFTICANDSVTLSASGAIAYSWSPGALLSDSTSSTPQFNPGSTTIFTVTGVNGSGCGDTASVTVTVLPSATAGGTVGSIPMGLPAAISFTNTSVNADSVLWSFGDGSSDTTSNPTHTYTADGTYTVTLTAFSSSGCNDVITFVVTITSASSMIIPNFFSPNFDDLNDIWRPDHTGIKEFSCVIFDRWGLKMYEWDRPNGWWDGRTTAGMECPDGVYYYIIKATGFDGKEYDEKGYLHLFR